MLEISEAYLEDEVRDGFYIPSIAKRAWAAELSILHEINRICEKYDIRYFADWGSFLGAVRHQGFIPWDDDLDICMFRSDLNKFIEVSKLELPEGFEIHSFLNNDYSWKFIINVVNTGRMCFTPDYLKTHFNFPYIATIDIFVIDNVYEDEDKEEERRKIVKYVLGVADILTEENYKSSKIGELLSEIEMRCNVSINKNLEFIELKRLLYKITQDIISEYNNDSSEYVVQQIPWGVYHNRKYKRELYDGIVKLPFEDTYICVPKLYDRLLRNKYGNYWEIHMGVGGHGYPYYNSQKEALGLGADEYYIPQYRFSYDLVNYDTNGKPFIDGLDKRRQLIEAVGEFKKSEDYNGEFDRETVIFLPFKGEHWDNMLPFYYDEINRDNTDVFVIPIPYYYKEYNGSLNQEKQFNLEKYPEELPVYLYDEIDLEAIFADRIYIQNPYDEYNMCMSVPVQFYASNLRNITRKLIYVPWFNTMDFQKDNYPNYYNMKYYCTLPGVVLADEVILNSKTVKDRYIDKLCEFAGDELRGVWEQKIVVKNQESVTKTPPEKKKLLFYTSPSTVIENGSKYINKLYYCINIFKENRALIDVIWYLDNYSLSIIKKFDEELYDKVIEIRDEYIANEFTIVSEGTSDTEYVEMCSAYYGDPSHLVKDFWVQKKPVMISNVDIS